MRMRPMLLVLAVAVLCTVPTKAATTDPPDVQLTLVADQANDTGVQTLVQYRAETQFNATSRVSVGFDATGDKAQFEQNAASEINVYEVAQGDETAGSKFEFIDVGAQGASGYQAGTNPNDSAARDTGLQIADSTATLSFTKDALIDEQHSAPAIASAASAGTHPSLGLDKVGWQGATLHKGA